MTQRLAGFFALFGVLLCRAQTPSFEIPLSIPHDYSTDVTTNLQAVLDSTPDNARILFPELPYNPQTVGYRIEGTLTLAKRQNLTIEGRGAHLRAFDPLDTNRFSATTVRTRSQWRISGSTNITLLDLTVYGAHTNAGKNGTYDETREAQTAYDITGGSVSVRVERCKAFQTFGDGIYIGGNSRHVSILHCHVATVGRQCLAPCSGSNFLIQSNLLEDSRRGIIDIEPYASTWQVDNIRILDNVLGSSRLLCFPMAGGGQYGAIFIARNTALGDNGVPKIAYGRTDAPARRGPFIALLNQFTVGGSSAPGFQFQPVDGILFAGNWSRFPATRAMTAVRLRDSRGAVLANNLFRDAEIMISADSLSLPLWSEDNTTTENTWTQRTIFAEFPDAPACYYASIAFPTGRLLAIFRLRDGDEPLSHEGLTTRSDFAVVRLDPQNNLVEGFSFRGTSDYRGTDLPWLRPDTPSNLSADALSPSQIRLAWTVEGDEQSRVQIEVANNFPVFVPIGSTSITQSQFLAEGLHYNQDYHFRLCVSNPLAVSEWSSPVFARTFNVLPTSPSDLRLTVISDGRIDVHWADRSDNENGFRIERARDVNGMPGEWQTAGMAPRNATAWANTGLAASTRYHFRVRAFNEIGESAPCPSASAETLPLQLPRPPADLYQTNRLLFAAIEIRWHDQSDNENGFQIERAPEMEGQPGPWLALATVSNDSTTFVDTNVQPSAVFYYRLRAFNEMGASDWSVPVRAVAATRIVETWTAASGSPWPSLWIRTGTNVAVSVQNNRGQIGGGGAGLVLMAVNTPLARDVDQQVRMNFNNNSIRGGFFVRRHPRDPMSYYGVETGTDGNNRSLFKVVNGTKTTLLALPPLLTGPDYWMRFRAENRDEGGTRLRVRIWLEGEPEPEEWTADTTDEEPCLQNRIGQFGLLGAINISGTRRIQFDDYTAWAAWHPTLNPGIVVWISATPRFPQLVSFLEGYPPGCLPKKRSVDVDPCSAGWYVHFF